MPPTSTSPLDALTREINRLRQYLWEIAIMTGYEAPEGDAPPPGELDPDVPELAVDSVKAHLADYLSYTNPKGSDINPAAGPDNQCYTCGQTITRITGRWVHLFNDALQQTKHTPAPATATEIEAEDDVVVRDDQIRQVPPTYTFTTTGTGGLINEPVRLNVPVGGPFRINRDGRIYYEE